jgi:hypothetical protein
VFLSGTVVWPLRALARRVRKPGDVRVLGSGRRIAVLASVAAWLTAGLNAVFLLGLLLVLPRALDLELQFGMPPLLVALLGIPMLTSALAIGLLLLAIPVWRIRGLLKVEGVMYSAVTMFAVVFVPFLLYWNLLGFRW